jgi:uncharacterized protein YunC (DUF1805 family)
MIEVVQIDLDHGTAVGIRIDLLKAPLLVIKAKKGFLMCGYLNISAAEQLEDVAAVVRGITTFDDMLDARVVSSTAGARSLGVRQGQTGREALEHLF